MKIFNNYDVSYCFVLKYKLIKDGVCVVMVMMLFVWFLFFYKKIILGIECVICVEYCLGVVYWLLFGFLCWVVCYFWFDDDMLF